MFFYKHIRAFTKFDENELFIFLMAFQVLIQRKHFNETLHPTFKYGKFTQKHHHNLQKRCLKTKK